jgi:hypothetical protein
VSPHSSWLRFMGIGAGGLVLVVITVQALRYEPQFYDPCEGVGRAVEKVEEAPFVRLAEQYLQQTRNWTEADYCVGKKWTEGGERIVAVLKRGKRVVGSGGDLQVHINPAAMTVTGERAYQ